MESDTEKTRELGATRLAKRIIPCLDVKDGRVVKGVHFRNLVDAGDPVAAAKSYDAQHADELVFLDISASCDGRGTMLDVVRRTARDVVIPLTVGGGIRSVGDIRELLLAGADKTSLNTAAVLDPELLREGAERFGLSAMHQLRGRVGRGDQQAHCYLVVYEQKKTAMERLQAMLDTTDGFRIAERDLQLRGAGDLMGIRQAGEEREDSFLKDCPVTLLEAANRDAAEVYSLPTLENEQLMDAARRRYRGMERIALN